MLGEFGWFTQRINYIKSCQKNIRAQACAENDNVNLICESMENVLVDPQNDYESLKTEQIDLDNRNILVRKLNSTRELRKVLLNATTTDLREHFPFFLVAPQLVSIFFPIGCINII